MWVIVDFCWGTEKNLPNGFAVSQKETTHFKTKPYWLFQLFSHTTQRARNSMHCWKNFRACLERSFSLDYPVGETSTMSSKMTHLRKHHTSRSFNSPQQNFYLWKSILSTYSTKEKLFQWLCYGAPNFFVKQEGKLRDIVNYRGLIRITKSNNVFIPRPDMFDCREQAIWLSKLDFISSFHQIRVFPGAVGKKALNTKCVTTSSRLCQ